ncbi:hypothetical protein [Actinomadura sp. 7K507]|uniref:hypothetical protein n=1 Tax=Actinomadura sp. 7K507 TaxID=2530365 RepID=UPI001405597E|nr:hypothetical protein [Actinomadura sp. 7K507]
MSRPLSTSRAAWSSTNPDSSSTTRASPSAPLEVAGTRQRQPDLLTVFFGFGIFSTDAALGFGEGARGFSAQPLGYLDERTLNAARNDGYSRVGYLTEPEFASAMAC